MMERLAVYLRLSLEDMDKQRRLVDESQGISNQRKLVGAFVARHPQLSQMEAVEYLDDGYTGTNFDRPQFTAMMEAAKRGEIQCIVVKDLSRFGRSYLEVGDYLEHVFPFLGIRFVSVNDHYDSNDYLGKTGGMEIAFRNFIYDSYSRDLSVKVRSAMRVRMEQGRFVNHTPYGYQKSPEDKHKMIPDPETAPVVRYIFRMAGEGKTTSEIARELNARGIPTPLEHKGHKRRPDMEDRQLMWCHVKVRNILRNEKYTGAMTNHMRESRHMRDKSQRLVPKEEWIVTKGAHEAIVSPEEFAAAALAIRPVRHTPHETGEVLDRVFYCGRCGRKLRKTWGRDVYFSCDTPTYLEDACCKGVRWSKTALEEALLPIYRAQLILLGQRAKELRREDSKPAGPHAAHLMAQLEQAISACDVEKVGLYEQYRQGLLTREGFIQRKGDLDARKAGLQEERRKKEAEIERRNREQVLEEAERREIEGYLAGLNAPPEQLKREMYGAIQRVTVYDNRRLSVRWRFEDLFSAANKQAEIEPIKAG